MKSNFALLLIICSGFIPFSAFAESKPGFILSKMTGNEFLRQCNKERVSDHKSFLDYGMCLGYIEGLGDGLSILQYSPPEGFDPICIPRGATIGQQKDVVMDYITKNPAIRHEIISVLAISAWRNAWPCSK